MDGNIQLLDCPHSGASHTFKRCLYLLTLQFRSLVAACAAYGNLLFPHPTRHADFRAYKPLAHQHEPEILQALGDAAGERLDLSFVAQSLDLARGIFVTAHLGVEEAVDSASLRSADEPDSRLDGVPEQEG